MHPEGSGAWGQGEVVCFVCLGGRACFGMQLQARLLPAGSCRPWLLPAGSCRPCLQAVASQPQSWPQTATSCVSRLCRPTPLGARWWPPSTSPAARCSSSLMTCWCWRRARWAGGARPRGAGSRGMGLHAAMFQLLGVLRGWAARTQASPSSRGPRPSQAPNTAPAAQPPHPSYSCRSHHRSCTTAPAAPWCPTLAASATAAPPTPTQARGGWPLHCAAPGASAHPATARSRPQGRGRLCTKRMCILPPTAA